MAERVVDQQEGTDRREDGQIQNSNPEQTAGQGSNHSLQIIAVLEHGQNGEDHAAHANHHIGPFVGRELVGGAAAETGEQCCTYGRSQQNQETGQGDGTETAGAGHSNADNGQNAADSLQPGTALLEKQNAEDQTDHRRQADHQTREGDSGHGDAVGFQNKIQNRLNKPEQQQFDDRLAGKRQLDHTGKQQNVQS